MSKTTNSKAGKWDFYLTDEYEDKFLHCKLKSYHLEKEDIDNEMCYCGPCVKFMYEVSPEPISERPDALVLAMGDVEVFLFSKEYEIYCESPTYDVAMICKDTLEEIEISCYTDIDEVVAALGKSVGLLEMVYYSTISISNPMAHLIYLIQLRDCAVQNVFFENPGDRYRLYRAEYEESLKRLDFYVEDMDCFNPYDNDVIADILEWEDYGNWYDFNFYDMIRATSRWISVDNLFEYFTTLKIMAVSNGKKVAYPIVDEDRYIQFFGDRCDESADVQEVYMEDIDRETINGLAMYEYGDTHNPFEIKILEADFISSYKNIPAIADNDSIEEV